MKITNQLPQYSATQKPKIDSGFDDALAKKISERSDNITFSVASLSASKLPPVDKQKNYAILTPNKNYPPNRVLREPTSEETEWLHARYDSKAMKFESDEYIAMMNDLYDFGITSSKPVQSLLGATDVVYDKDGYVTSYCGPFYDETLSNTSLGINDWFAKAIESFANQYALAKATRTPENDSFAGEYQSMQDISTLLSKIF